MYLLLQIMLMPLHVWIIAAFALQDLRIYVWDNIACDCNLRMSNLVMHLTHMFWMLWLGDAMLATNKETISKGRMCSF